MYQNIVIKKIKPGLALLLVLIFLLAACDQKGSTKPYPLHYSDAIMGTSYTVKVPFLPTAVSSKQLKFEIKDFLDRINGLMSTYLPDSELSQFNQNQSTQWQTVSEPLYAVLKEAKYTAELSHGAFDITVGKLVNLWGFGSEPMSFTAPDDEQIEKQLLLVGSQYLLLDDKTQQIKKTLPQLYLDLSALAKGYAVDQVGLLLEKHGIVDYMVEIGGELRLKGKNIENKAWRIAVEKPVAEQGMIQKVLSLSDVSMATSGDYRNFFETDGVRFSHTIDPRSGKPIKHKLASVTILSDTTMRADALATTMMVLGFEQGIELAEKEKIAAFFIVKTTDGFTEQASSSFEHWLR